MLLLFLESLATCFPDAAAWTHVTLLRFLDPVSRSSYHWAYGGVAVFAETVQNELLVFPSASPDASTYTVGVAVMSMSVHCLAMQLDCVNILGFMLPRPTDRSRIEKVLIR